MEDFAFASNTRYSLEDIQVIDPTARVEHDGEFGLVVFAIKEPIEYVFYPDDEEWALDHTWHGFTINRGIEQGRGAMTNVFEETRPDLKPARNLRRRKLMICATCKHWRNTAGFGYCVREGGFGCDVGDMDQYFHLCDGWAPKP